MAERKVLTSSSTIAISLGDPCGIGPELLHKSLDQLGPSKIFGHLQHRPSTLPDNCEWVSISGTPTTLGQPSEESGQQAYTAFKQAAQEVQSGNCQGLVTLPISKEYVALNIEGFHGHTDELNDWWGGHSLMTLIGGRLRVALVTDHEAIHDVPKLITVERVLEKARTLRDDIKRFFKNGEEPQLHLLGLNPHAGENGLIGSEESLLIEALNILKNEGGHWQGPWPADAFFARHDYGDGVLAIYHDQGLIPVKMLAEGQGVNVTLGLPFVRTSPDHGTAFDIAGKNKADHRAFVASIELARHMICCSQ